MDLESGIRDLQFIEQVVLMFRYYENEQLDRVAARLDQKIDAIAKIERGAIAKLRKHLRGE